MPQTANSIGLNVNLVGYDGPFELLLDLVENHRFDISNVSLSEVAQDFLSKISEFTNDPAKIANFLKVATILLLLKSRAILPRIILSEDEEMDVSDIAKRLKIYSEIRNASKVFQKIWGDVFLFEMKKSPKREFRFYPSKDMRIASLIFVARSLCSSLPIQEKRDEVQVKNAISIEEMMQNFENRLKNASKIAFSELNTKDKNELIVGFLAILELMRQGTIVANQKAIFGDIVMERT